MEKIPSPHDGDNMILNYYVVNVSAFYSWNQISNVQL